MISPAVVAPVVIVRWASSASSTSEVSNNTLVSVVVNVAALAILILSPVSSPVAEAW